MVQTTELSNLVKNRIQNPPGWVWCWIEIYIPAQGGEICIDIIEDNSGQDSIEGRRKTISLNRTECRELKLIIDQVFWLSLYNVVHCTEHSTLYSVHAVPSHMYW